MKKNHKKNELFQQITDLQDQLRDQQFNHKNQIEQLQLVHNQELESLNSKIDEMQAAYNKSPHKESEKLKRELERLRTENEILKDMVQASSKHCSTKDGELLRLRTRIKKLEMEHNNIIKKYGCLEEICQNAVINSGKRNQTNPRLISRSLQREVSQPSQISVTTHSTQLKPIQFKIH